MGVFMVEDYCEVLSLVLGFWYLVMGIIGVWIGFKVVVDVCGEMFFMVMDDFVLVIVIGCFWVVVVDDFVFFNI